jgi:hypothetical protein
MGWSKDVHVALCWLCLWLDASMMLLAASMESGLANVIGEREVFLFHRPEWGGAVLQA